MVASVMSFLPVLRATIVHAGVPSSTKNIKSIRYRLYIEHLNQTYFAVVAVTGCPTHVDHEEYGPVLELSSFWKLQTNTPIGDLVSTCELGYYGMSMFQGLQTNVQR